jgi:plasmid maintenance system antidote protein VapI
MQTTTDRYLDAVKSRLSITSDYALAKKWDVTPQRIGNYRRGESALSDERCIQVAEILGIPPENVLLEVQAERARKAGKDKVSEVLESVLRRLSATAAAMTFGLCLSAGFYADDSAAAESLPYAESNTGLFREHLTDNVNYAKCRHWFGLILLAFRRLRHYNFGAPFAAAL